MLIFAALVIGAGAALLGAALWVGFASRGPRSVFLQSADMQAQTTAIAPPL